MPIYEYKCTKCNESFEELVLSSDKEIRCPKCDANEVEKQLSLFATKGENTSPCGSRECATIEKPQGGCCGGGCPLH